ncbi:MAG: serine hydrolase domain-containing protein [Rhodanobacteraceae bacterium]
MRIHSRWLLGGLLAFLASAAWADAPQPVALHGRIDQAVNKVLATTGVPSASIALVKDGKIAYAQAYGKARLPDTAAKPGMRYSIGSISKQFAAAAILMLQQQGKLSLDDKLSKYFPDLTRANDITLRELLSHTSGYQDYWPEDYVMPGMMHATTPARIMDTWAKKPLDFEPGSKWQYSNTGFVIIGAIIQKVSGLTPFEFLQKNVLPQLGIKDAYNTNLKALPATDARGYTRFALGPPRPAPKEGAGWMFGAGELAMTAQDLAQWDISVLKQSLLQPSSYRALETEVVLNNGLGSQYGLGVHVGSEGGRRVISHSGEVSGFTAMNVIYPDDDAAVVVLVNQDATPASDLVAKAIAKVLFDVQDPAAARALAQAREIFTGLQHGRIDRALFTSNCNAYFDATALKDYANSLAPLGTPQKFEQTAWRLRGGMTMRAYKIRFPKMTLDLSTYTMPDGKLEQYIVAPVVD